MADDTDSIGENSRPPGRSWVSRRKGAAFVFGIVALLILMQWPMVKNMIAGVLGIPMPEDHIGWRTDYAVALAESRSSGKPVLIDFAGPYCPPCQVMKREVWPDEEVSQLVKSRYIPLLQDVELSSSYKAATRYDVYGLPDVIIVDADGKLLRRAQDYSKAAMLRFLSQP